MSETIIPKKELEIEGVNHESPHKWYKVLVGGTEYLLRVTSLGEGNSVSVQLGKPLNTVIDLLMWGGRSNIIDVKKDSDVIEETIKWISKYFPDESISVEEELDLLNLES